jgi:type IV pilus assembly protein PilB
MAMGQRLVRKLCGKCKKKVTLDANDIKKISEEIAPIQKRFSLPNIDEKTTFYSPGECEECNNIGYKGRTGVYEVFEITRAMEKLILDNASVSDIRDLAIKEGMVTMLQDGYLKLLQGVTSLEEIRRVLG